MSHHDLISTEQWEAMSGDKTLDQLAEQINEEYAEAVRQAESAMDRAMRVGSLLLAAKKQVGHGRFMDWVADHTDVPHRTATNWMKIAKNRNSTDATIGINEALRLLAGPKEKPRQQQQIRYVREPDFTEEEEPADDEDEEQQEDKGELVETIAVQNSRIGFFEAITHYLPRQEIEDLVRHLNLYLNKKK